MHVQVVMFCCQKNLITFFQVDNAFGGRINFYHHPHLMSHIPKTNTKVITSNSNDTLLTNITLNVLSSPGYAQIIISNFVMLDA